MRKLFGLCFVLLLLPRMLSAIEISDNELTRLDQIFSELKTQIATLQTDLAESRTALSESTDSLTRARASLTQYESVAEAALKAARAERDQARACAVATGIAGLVAVIVVFIVK